MNRRKIKYCYTGYSESGLVNINKEGYLLDFTISNYNDLSDDINIMPLAIVETKEGNIQLINIDNIKFIDGDEH